MKNIEKYVDKNKDITYHNREKARTFFDNLGNKILTFIGISLLVIFIPFSFSYLGGIFLDVIYKDVKKPDSSFDYDESHTYFVDMFGWKIIIEWIIMFLFFSKISDCVSFLLKGLDTHQIIGTSLLILYSYSIIGNLVSHGIIKNYFINKKLI